MGEIKLSGSEITVLKTLGLTGATATGEVLSSRLHGFEDAELLDTLQGLIQVGYILASKENIRLVPDMHKASYRINSAYIKTLQESLDPRARQMKKKPRRRRRE